MKDEYFAGLFDGEGYIGAQIDRRNRSPGWQSYNVQPRVGIGMAHAALPILMQINAQYGGRLREHRRNLPNTTVQRVSYITWDGKINTEIVLEKLEPHLVIKREQARLSLWWVKNVEGVVIDAAKDIFITDLKAMKVNMLLTAESSIVRIKACLNNKNVVSISR